MRLRLPLLSLSAISIGFITAMSAAILATGLAVYVELGEAIDQAVDRRLASEAWELLQGEPDATELARRIKSATGLRESGDIGYLLERRGVPIVQNIRPAHRLPIGLSTVGPEINIPGLSRGRALVIKRPDRATLSLIVESEPIDKDDQHRLFILAAGFGTILILVIAGTTALGLVVRHHIETVRGAAEAIFEGDMTARVPVTDRASAFGRQALAFNRMLDRIEGLMTSLKEISNDIAHDLRTPLARLHHSLRDALSQDLFWKARPILMDAVGQSEDVLDMFAAILRISEVENGRVRRYFERLDLADLADEVVCSLEAMVTNSARAIGIHSPGAIWVEGDRRLLEQLLVNLIENAVNHTPAGTEIIVDVSRKGQQANLAISDNGPGIAQKDYELALRRFGRIDLSRQRPGNGLGLTLAQAIAKLHDSELKLGDAKPGLRVAMSFPCIDLDEGAQKGS